MPLMMRRSSSRSGPVSPVGRCGSIRAHCLSFSQNKPARTLSPPNQEHISKKITWRYLGTDPSIVDNGPERFEGRKLGILVSDGSDAALLKAIKAALDKAGATFEIIAPKVTGVKANDGSWIDADQMIDGGPSVLYDAIALLPAPKAIDDLLQESSVRDFVADAFAHCKFIGYVESALSLFEKAGVAADDFDEGCVAIGNSKDAKAFVDNLAKLRVWGREPNVKMP